MICNNSCSRTVSKAEGEMIYKKERHKETMEICLELIPGRVSLRESLWGKLRRRIFSFLEAVTGNEEGTLSAVSGSSEKERTAQNAGRLLESHGDSILRLAYSYLHNMSDAEDIVQETLIKYIRTAPEFESEAHEKAWLLRVAANLSKNRIDYNKVRQTDELSETLIADEREDLSFVWEAVKALPDNMRDVIHLFYHEGYQTKEIAGILGRKESTVRSDLRRGREKLREVLKEAYDFE